MAASLVGGAAVGAVFGELLKAILEIKDKAVMFKQTLIYLQSTLVAIAPVVKEIEQYNNDLGRPKEELESLIREMEEGTKLVCKCSKIHRLNYVARIRYQEQLVALVDSLVKFFIIDMQAQTARDQKETLLKVTRILSKVNKIPLLNIEDITVDSSSESEIHDSSATQRDENSVETNSVEEAMEHSNQVTGSSTSESTAIQLADDAAGTNSTEHVMELEPITCIMQKACQTAESAMQIDSAELVMEHISRITRSSFSDIEPVDVSDSESFYSTVTQLSRTNSSEQFMNDTTRLMPAQESQAKVENNQAMEQLMSRKPYDKLFSCIQLPKIRGFSRRVKKAALKPLPENFVVLEGCPYDFGLGDIVGASLEVTENLSYGTTYKAILEDGKILLVNTLKDVVVEKKELGQLVDSLQRIPQHPNVMPLLAYYYSEGEMLQIYDNMNADSFSRLLHGTRDSGGTRLDWDSRLKISLCAARGIAHIHYHSAVGRKIFHGNITSCNVLVRLDLQSCILHPLLTPPANLSANKGYQAPEVFETGKMTEKSDVYSFGILLLEMLTGKSPIEYDLRGYVGDDYVLDKGDGIPFYLTGKSDVAIGHDMGGKGDSMVELALDCVLQEPKRRPSMEGVVSRIEEVITPEFKLDYSHLL